VWSADTTLMPRRMHRTVRQDAGHRGHGGVRSSTTLVTPMPSSTFMWRAETPTTVGWRRPLMPWVSAYPSATSSCDRRHRDSRLGSIRAGQSRRPSLRPVQEAPS
jgi:hypothetical protein